MFCAIVILHAELNCLCDAACCLITFFGTEDGILTSPISLHVSKTMCIIRAGAMAAALPAFFSTGR